MCAREEKKRRLCVRENYQTFHSHMCVLHVHWGIDSLAPNKKTRFVLLIHNHFLYALLLQAPAQICSCELRERLCERIKDKIKWCTD